MYIYIYIYTRVYVCLVTLSLGTRCANNVTKLRDTFSRLFL